MEIDIEVQVVEYVLGGFVHDFKSILFVRWIGTNSTKLASTTW